MSEKQAIIAMEEYLEPSVATKQRAIEYYEARSKSKDFIKSSVDDVKIDELEEFAEVRYTSIIGSNENNTKTHTQTTNWIKKNGIWYRTIESSFARYNQ